MNKSKINVCSTLLQDHRQMEQLLDQLRQALDLNPAYHLGIEPIKTVMDLIVSEMNTHFTCEEQVLFPTVSPYHPMVLMEAEHAELIAMRDSIVTLLRLPAITPESIAQLQENGNHFIDDMLDHIAREDAGIFPACEQALSDNEKASVIAGMATIRQKAL